MEPLLKTIKEIGKAPIWKEKILVIFLLITVLFNLFLWFFVYLNYRIEKEITVIHYSVLSGIDWLDKKIYLFRMPAAGLIIFLINFFLTKIFYQKGREIIAYFLCLSSFFVNSILIVAAILIISL